MRPGNRRQEHSQYLCVATSRYVSLFKLNLTPRLHPKRGRATPSQSLFAFTHPSLCHGPWSPGHLEDGDPGLWMPQTRLKMRHVVTPPVPASPERERVRHQVPTRGDSTELGSLSNLGRVLPRPRSFSVPSFLPTVPLKELGFSESAARKREVGKQTTGSGERKTQN